MTIYGILCFMDAFLITTATTSNAKPCAVFELQSPTFINNSYTVNENSEVNITFFVLNLNCSNMSIGVIDISKKDLVSNRYGRQCSIYETCNDGPINNNKSCQCLSEQGLYSFSFIATRQDNACWKWSTTNGLIEGFTIEIIVIYPSHVTRLEIIGYDGSIPRHKSVSVFCTWENGNPPSEVRLLDRENKVLAFGNESGNISYTFHSIDCINAGTIRCEAFGSDKNISIKMLVECAPEILLPHPKSIHIMYVQQNVNISFSFRSHEAHLYECHLTQQTRSKHSYSCTNVSAYFTIERKLCVYSVTGTPPDLHLTLQIQNLKPEDAGLWYLNVSNNKGSDGMYIQLENNVESNHISESVNEGKSKIYTRPSVIEESNSNTVLQTHVIIGIVLGIITFIVIVFVVVYCIKRGKDTYFKLARSEMKEMSVYKVLEVELNNRLNHSQSESSVYHEIHNSSIDEDFKLQSSSKETRVQLHDSSSADSSLIANGQTASSNTTNTAYVEPVISETTKEQLRFINIQTNIRESTLSDSYNYLQPSQAGKMAKNIPVMPKDLKPISTASKTLNIVEVSGDLKYDQTRGESSNVPHRLDDVNNILARNENDNRENRSKYLTPTPKVNETRNVEDNPDYLQPVQRN